MKQDVRVENAKWDAALRRDRLSAAREGVVKALEGLTLEAEALNEDRPNKRQTATEYIALARAALKEYHDATN